MALLAFGLLVFVLSAELALRAVYRDAGTRTLSGPGGLKFEHDTIDGELRGRLDYGTKRPGVPRVMIVGDSITYGQGIRDWRLTWPERLAVMLEANGQSHEFAVFAAPGRDILHHLEVVQSWTPDIAPDVFIYQWYVNDIESSILRPDLRHRWQQLPWHPWLNASSYLYYFVSQRLSQIIPPPEQSYLDYLLTIAPGTRQWAEFERHFHEMSLRAGVAERRFLMLYPQVPFRGTYPLQAIHDQMRRLTGPHMLDIPPLAWARLAGEMTTRVDAPHQHAISVPRGAIGPVIQTAAYYLPPRDVVMDVTMTADVIDSDVAVVHLIDEPTQRIVASAPLRVTTAGSMNVARVRLSLAGEQPVRVAVRVDSSGAGAWTLANLGIPVDYGYEMLDLTETLNSFPTHVSAFDAHPNARAQQVMADVVFAALTTRR